MNLKLDIDLEIKVEGTNIFLYPHSREGSNFLSEAFVKDVLFFIQLHKPEIQFLKPTSSKFHYIFSKYILAENC